MSDKEFTVADIAECVRALRDIPLPKHREEVGDGIRASLWLRMKGER